MNDRQFFYYKDEEDNEIKVELEKLEYSKDDSIVVYIDVGRLPPKMAEELVNNIKKEFDPSFFKTKKILFAPMRDGKKSIEFGVIKYPIAKELHH